MKVRKKYAARWHGTATLREVANVTIMACNDRDARQQAAKVAKGLAVANCTLTIYDGGRPVPA